MNKNFITVIDYGSGNLRSAAKACAHAAQDLGLDLEVRVSDKADDILGASHLVLPGQGAFGDCMDGLQGHSGALAALKTAVLERKTPFLGICVGMQLLATIGREHGDHEGLGWLAGEVIAIEPKDASYKIPHMGWNSVTFSQDHPVLDGLEDGAHFYFVHSYHMRLDDSQHLLMQCSYGEEMCAAVAKNNIIGVQFHPEKSADAGLRLISNFLTWQADKP